MFRVSYSQEFNTNLYRVTLHAINQTIILSRNLLVSKIGMNPKCAVGCQDISTEQVLNLGFIFPTRKDVAI